VSTPRPSHVAGGCWPTPLQERLLDVLVGPEDRVASAFARWRAEADLDALDTSSFKLLPLLYRRLTAADIYDPALPRLKGVYRHAWARNQLLLRAAAGVILALEADGIPTLTLKGASLATLWYGDLGARPMADVDVLVRPADAPRATARLAALGWTPRFPPESVLNDAYHGLDHRDPRANAIDLHWYVGPDAAGPGADDEEWTAATPFTLMGAPTRALAPTDLLMHVIVHGLRWSPVAPIRWVADAMQLFRAGAPIDWDRVARRGASRALGLTLERGLDYLARRFGAPVPPETLAALRDLHVPRWERVEYALKTRSRYASVLGPLALLWLRHRRVVPHLGPVRRTLDFPRFARERLRARSWVDVSRGLAFQLRRQLDNRRSPER